MTNELLEIMAEIKEYVVYKLTGLSYLRGLVKLGCHGKAHLYAEQVYLHYNDCGYVSRSEFEQE